MDGKNVQEFMPFDPAVLTDDDGRVYLYYGFAPAAEKAMNIPEVIGEKAEQMTLGEKAALEMLKNIQFSQHGMVTGLKPDMLTVEYAPKQFTLPVQRH